MIRHFGTLDRGLCDMEGFGLNQLFQQMRAIDI
jgi:hypothetical protein